MQALKHAEPWYETVVWWSLIVVCVAAPMVWELGKACLRER